MAVAQHGCQGLTIQNSTPCIDNHNAAPISMEARGRDDLYTHAFWQSIQTPEVEWYSSSLRTTMTMTPTETSVGRLGRETRRASILLLQAD
jgi:hypothetical protein